MKYIEWDELRKEFGFTPEEEVEITRKAARMVRDRKLTQSIAQAVAEVDAKRWGQKIPAENHALWQVYAAYGEAALKTVRESENTAPGPDSKSKE